MNRSMSYILASKDSNMHHFLTVHYLFHSNASVTLTVVSLEKATEAFECICPMSVTLSFSKFFQEHHITYFVRYHVEVIVN